MKLHTDELIESRVGKREKGRRKKKYRTWRDARKKEVQHQHRTGKAAR